MNNIIPHRHIIDTEKRSAIKGHGPAVLWFTGLSGSGKSTIASEVEKKLNAKKIHTMILDGDNVRTGLCADLGFSAEDRQENTRRIASVARLFYQAGIVTLVCFISPFRKDRDYARSLIPEGDFFEIFIKCSVSECEKRDVKGLYKKARAGEISNFTGIDSPYEEPVDPEVVVDTENQTMQECVEGILKAVNGEW